MRYELFAIVSKYQKNIGLLQNQEQPLPQTSVLFNQFSGVVAIEQDASSSASSRSPSRIQGISIAGTSSASLHFRMPPAGGGEIEE